MKREDDQGICTVFKKQWEQAKEDVSNINTPFLGGLILIGLFLGWLLSDARTGIAGGTFALIIAFVAYPWQKGLDRKNQLRLEQRKTYLDYVKACNALMETYRKMDGRALQVIATSDSARRQHDELLSELMIVGHEEVVMVGSEVNNIFFGFLGDLKMKVSLLGADPTEGDVEKAVSGVIQDTSAKYDTSMEKFVNLVRRLEFGGSGYLELKSRYSLAKKRVG